MPEIRIKVPLAIKIYLITLVSIAFCAISIGTFNYYESKKIISQNIGNMLQNIARTAVLAIDADKIKKIESAKDPFYSEVRRYLIDVKSSNDIKAPIYILKRINEHTASLIVTTEPSLILGAHYKINPTLRKVFDTGLSEFSPIYKDKNGTWISSYAPIKDSSAEIIGVIELNHHVEYYMVELRYKLLHIISLCFLGFLIGTFLGIPLLKPILNSVNVLNTAASEIEKGNYDYEVRLKSSDEIGHLARTFEKMRLAIKDYIEKLKEAWLNEKKAHLESVKTLSEAIAVREPYTKDHIERVSNYAELIAKELGLSAEEIEILKYGCVLHDVGKIGISVDIINKPSRLTPEEYEHIKRHPDLGAKIMEGVKFFEKARDIILYHQERYDGKGYPAGLKGEEIPLSARIVSLADAYDAMSSDRPYRKRLDKDEIVARIEKESGKQFDPKVVEAFLKIKDKLPEEYNPLK